MPVALPEAKGGNIRSLHSERVGRVASTTGRFTTIRTDRSRIMIAHGQPETALSNGSDAREMPVFISCGRESKGFETRDPLCTKLVQPDGTGLLHRKILPVNLD